MSRGGKDKKGKAEAVRDLTKCHVGCHIGLVEMGQTTLIVYTQGQLSQGYPADSCTGRGGKNRTKLTGVPSLQVSQKIEMENTKWTEFLFFSLQN